MAEATYHWPTKDQVSVIGQRQDRLDGLVKATGMAKYSYDINLKNMLVARALGCPHSHCRIKAIDTRAAEAVPGVVKVHVLPHAEPDSEIQWQGELIAIVAAETEAIAVQGVAKLKVEYELLDVFTSDEDLEAAERAGRTSKAGQAIRTENEPDDDEDEEEFEQREIARLFGDATHVVEGYYGIDVITHCCLEPHGSTVHWDGDTLIAYLSTQNVSGTSEGFAKGLDITGGDVEVRCDFIGGGFGSKFAADYWGIAAARIARETGRPVKLMLDRDQELKLGGTRPSGFLKVKLGANSDGVVTVWDSHHWGTGGLKGGVGHTIIPYVFSPPNYRRKATSIQTNTAQARAWRAPGHPQACAMSQTAYDDLAAEMGADSFEIYMRNLKNISSNQKSEVYAEEMRVAADLIGWKQKWHPHGKGATRGSIVEGLGLALHTWGGTANQSSVTIKVHPDGGVETFCGTQDLGTGTRTVCAMVVAETFGVPVEAVKVNIGTSKYPTSGASGGSTTVGGVSESHRRASQDALRNLFKLAGEKLGVDADALEAAGGRIRVQGDATKGLSWKQTCSLLGLKPLEATAGYKRGTKSPLSSSGVGGVQMAEVAVDKETGVVKIKKYVAVQDMGLVINPKTAESQIYGAVIMGIAYALFEQRICDPTTGAFLNAELADYKLARLGDVGEIVVHLYEPESERERGVIGLGEPPVISPGAAISNAVANALGVRVPVLPLTPKRVLDALANVGRA